MKPLLSIQHQLRWLTQRAAVALTLTLALGAGSAFADVVPAVTADELDVRCEGTRVQPALFVDANFSLIREMVMRPRPGEGLVAFIDRPPFEDHPWGDRTVPTYSVKPRIGFKNAAGKVVIEPRFYFAHPCTGVFGYGEGMATFIKGRAAVLTHDGARFIDKWGNFVGEHAYTAVRPLKTASDGPVFWATKREQTLFMGLYTRTIEEEIDPSTLRASTRAGQTPKGITAGSARAQYSYEPGLLDQIAGPLARSPFDAVRYLGAERGFGGDALVALLFSIAGAWASFLAARLTWHLFKRLGIWASVRTVLLVPLGAAGLFVPVAVLGLLCSVLLLLLLGMGHKRSVAAA